MRLLNFFATLGIILVAVSGYAQKTYSTDVLKYSFKEQTDPKRRPVNYWVVKPPQRGSAYNQVERIIVRLKSQPGKKNSAGRIAISPELESEHLQFLRDLQQMEGRSVAGRSKINSKILFDYKRTFNGFALITSKAIREEIEKLDYVVSVSEDKEVKITDLESSAIINAPKVWSDLSITGKGVRIGIIDTGVDYNHPDLGGGFGPSFKVIGGYDFYNQDSDPRDDHGHGTHVAGIASANGPGLQGVAPDAKIVAYKVLGAEGYGNDSGILAAIERSVDPDQNPGTDDALDVVNMSLGRSADPFEPISEAVNNAVLHGVNYVVAAGNNWDYLTIGTPALAEKAITVAATDNFDFTASFSSKGPVERTFAIKPDVSAPGVQIYSSFKDNGYQRLDGTSMASPHVAGAVALILEKHPDWTPEMVKGALMGTAKKSFESIWNQGAGRIDVFDAINSDFTIAPGSFSVGMPEKTAAWTKTIKAKVYNLSSSSKSFVMSVEGIVNPSIAISFTPSSFTLNANSLREVDVKFTVNALALAVQNFPDSYSGSIVTTSASKNIKSPVALINSQVTKLKFEGELPPQVFVFGIEGTSYLWKAYFPTSSELDLFLPLAKYDIISMFYDNHTVVTEGVTTDQNKTIQLSKALAKNRLIFKPLDKNGQAIPITETTFGTALFTGIDRNFMTFYPYAEDTFYISDQNVYRYDMKVLGMTPGDPDHYYDVSAATNNGITQGGTFSNKTSDFTALTIHNPSANTEQGLQYHSMAGGWTTWNSYPISVSNPLRVLSSQNGPSLQQNGAYARLVPTFQQPGYAWETSIWKAQENDNLIFQDKSGVLIANYTTPSFTYRLGETLVRYATPTSNASDRIIIMDLYYTGIFNRYLGERERGTIHYDLRNSSNALVKTGYIANNTHLDLFNAPSNLIIEALPQQPHTLSLTYEDYQVRGKFGKATVELGFDLSMDDKNPPHIDYLSLDVNGKSTDQIMAGEEGKIVTRINDWCSDPFTWQSCNSWGLASVTIKIRKTESNDWQNLQVLATSGSDFESSLPFGLTEGYYDLLLEATDYSNNILTYELKPGFLVGPATESTPYAAVNLIAPLNKDINAGTNPEFRWSVFPGSTYTIQLSDTPDFISPIEMNNATEIFMLPSPLEENKTYYWRVQAKNGNNTIPWSVIFSFYSGTLKATTLLEPLNESISQPLAIQFKWDKVAGASSYGFLLSSKEDFSEIQNQTYLYENTLFVDNLLPGTRYYWSVSTNYFTWDNNYYIPSSVNNFQTTGDITTDVLGEESSGSFFNYPNPFPEKTKFVFTVNKPGPYTIVVTDALGQVVTEITSYSTSSGKYEVHWDGKNSRNESLLEGFYIARLRTPESERNLKIILKR